jgi:predicted MFS family arabinose efflux permease
VRYARKLRSDLETLWQGERGPALFAVSAGWFLSLGVRMVFPALLPALRDAYGLSLTTGGLLITVLWVAYAVGQLPGGILSDRLGERDVLIASTAISAVLLSLLVLADSVVVVFAATALFGLGTALYGVARFTAAAALYPDNDGVAIGVTLAAGQIGNALLPAAAGAIAAATAWQSGFGVTVPIFLVVAALLWRALPAELSAGDGGSGPPSRELIDEVLSEVRRPAVVLTALVLTLGFGVWQAFTGFYPTYLIERKGLSPTVAASLFGLYFALGIGIQPAAGAAYDRYGIGRTLPILFVIVIGGLLALPTLEGFWPLAAITVVLSFMLGNIAVLLPYLTARLPDAIQGTCLGLIRTVYMTIGAASPLVFGAIADRGLFDEAFWLLAAGLAANLLLVLRLPDGE